MEILDTSELIDCLAEMIRVMETNEDRFYVAIDVAHQLRDEIKQALTE